MIDIMRQLAAQDPRLADLVDTIKSAQSVTTAVVLMSEGDADLNDLIAASFMHGFVTAARLAEQDASSLAEIMAMLRTGPMGEGMLEIDRDEFTKDLRRRFDA